MSKSTGYQSHLRTFQTQGLSIFWIQDYNLGVNDFAPYLLFLTLEKLATQVLKGL